MPSSDVSLQEASDSWRLRLRTSLSRRLGHELEFHSLEEDSPRKRRSLFGPPVSIRRPKA